MKNVVSYQMAIALRDAGFPQPEVERGQVWLGTDGRDCIVLDPQTERGQVLIHRSHNDLIWRDNLSDLVFAPTSSYIMFQLFLVGTSLHFDVAAIVKMALSPDSAAIVWVQRQKVKISKEVIKSQEPHLKTGQEYWLKNVGEKIVLTEYDLPAEDFVKKHLG